MQAALERLLRQGRRISGNPEGYLRRTLYNLAADRWRRQETWRQLIMIGHHYKVGVEFSWLPPNKANLSMLHQRIPASFKHISA